MRNHDRFAILKSYKLRAIIAKKKKKKWLNLVSNKNSYKIANYLSQYKKN